MGQSLSTPEREPEPVLLKIPWRNLGEFATKSIQDLLRDLTDLDIPKDTVKKLSKYKILLVGPNGQGKTSFVNSVNSVLARKIKPLGTAMRKETTVTHEFFSYEFRGTKFILCDTMGLHAREGQETAGARFCDLKEILDGHITESFMMDTEKDHKTHSTTSKFGDQIHCVVLCLNAEDLETQHTDRAMRAQVKQFQEYVRKSETPFMIILTHIDKVCPFVKKDGVHVTYRSKSIKQAVDRASDLFGVDKGRVFPVKNYVDEIVVDEHVDRLVLTALIKMMDYAEGHLERFGVEGAAAHQV